jgi:hypothetical protein
MQISDTIFQAFLAQAEFLDLVGWRVVLGVDKGYRLPNGISQNLIARKCLRLLTPACKCDKGSATNINLTS